jgi:hypothetical protein
VLISLRYSLFDFQGQISKKGNTVGGDEQQEIAISPLIQNIFVARFLEHIPYM